jgi:hypothetical protein
MNIGTIHLGYVTKDHMILGAVIFRSKNSFDICGIQTHAFWVD